MVIEGTRGDMIASVLHGTPIVVRRGRRVYLEADE